MAESYLLFESLDNILVFPGGLISFKKNWDQ
jgi:hypothetical protein